jgi:peptidyl-prolyl cis-trans isomerase B (cyclophilin B)
VSASKALFFAVLFVFVPSSIYAQAPAGLTATLACTRQAVGGAESFPIKLTIANESHAPNVAFDRADVLSSRSLVAATYEKKGHWVTIHDEPAGGKLELRPGESFAITFKVTMPEALTKTPSGLLVQWVGRGALDGLRSNELTVAIREDKNPTAAIDTSEGLIVLELWPDKAPNHVANLLTLAKSGFYDGKLFHRVIPNFMVQTGCPLGTGTGDPGYKIAAEFNDTPFAKGVLGMARAGDPDSAGSQFFICVADSPDVKSLDKKYTAFGRVIEGQDVADKIAASPRDMQKGDRPYKDVVMRRVTVALPATYTLTEVKKVGAAAPANKPESRPEKP